MEIRAPGDLLRLPPAALSPRAWSVGEILNAVVAKATQGGAAQLRIGQQVVTAETQIPLKQGQQLTLRVLESSQRPVLQVLTQATSNAGDEQIRGAALKNALPQQQPVAQTFSSLERIATRPLPSGFQPLKAGIEEVLSKVPPQQALRAPNQLKRAIADSGIFLEARLQAGLASPSAPPQQDLKSALQRVATIIRSMPQLPVQTGQPPTGKPAPQVSTPVPPNQTAATNRETIPATSTGTAVAITSSPPATAVTKTSPTAIAAATAAPADDAPMPAQSTTQVSIERLAREVDSALARIQVNQLSSVPVQDGSQQHLWLIEVPVRGEQGFDTLQMVIEREPESGEDQQSAWSLTLSFSLEPLGPISVRLRLFNQQIDAGFWAERAPTQHLIETELSLFGAALTEVGLNPGHLHVLNASPLPDASRHLPRGLLSEQV